MNEAEKERLIKKDLVSIENRVRHAFNQGYEMGLKENKKQSGDAISRQAVLDAFWKLDVELSPTAIWTIQNMVKDVPSVTPQPIECEERKSGNCPFYAN